MLSSELARDGAPLRLMLLGEKLIAFRDSAGRVGVMDHRCPHRCASLFLGRNEEGGIRCIYHGWNPILPHQLAHYGLRADSREFSAFYRRCHLCPPLQDRSKSARRPQYCLRGGSTSECRATVALASGGSLRPTRRRCNFAAKLPRGVLPKSSRDTAQRCRRRAFPLKYSSRYDPWEAGR